MNNRYIIPGIGGAAVSAAIRLVFANAHVALIGLVVFVIVFVVVVTVAVVVIEKNFVVP